MTLTGLILAEDGLGLQEVYHVPAVRRLIVLMGRLGVARVHVMSRDQRVLAAVSDLVGQDRLHSLDESPGPDGIAGQLRLQADEPVLVLKAHHVIDKDSLDRLLKASGREGTACLRMDGTGPDKAIYLARAAGLPGLLASLVPSRGRETATAAPDPEILVEGRHGLPLLLDGGPKEMAAAEKGLIDAVIESTIPRDSLLSRLMSRRISRLMSPTAARIGMTANMVTLCDTIVGLAGAFLLFKGGYWPMLAGSFLFLLNTIFDGVDGEVARLTLGESTFGYRLDVTCDNIVHAAVFIGTALGLYHESGNVMFVYLLFFFFAGAGLCGFMLNTILSEHHAGNEPSRLALWCEAAFNNRDFAYLMTGMALFHRLDWFFVAATFGTYLLPATLWAIRLASRPAAGKN